MLMSVENKVLLTLLFFISSFDKNIKMVRSDIVIEIRIPTLLLVMSFNS